MEKSAWCDGDLRVRKRRDAGVTMQKFTEAKDAALVLGDLGVQFSLPPALILDQFQQLVRRRRQRSDVPNS